ncbi:MAG: hypothetical protein KAJ10_05265 [Thermodesulfovibrionia bacterium]|nr:hypothetical protein [Thermodesulfovibrionia bacterium]
MRRPNRRPTYLEPGDLDGWQETADYIVYVDGADYVGRNGATGVDDYRSTAAETTINNCIAALTTGNVVVVDDVTLTNQLVPAQDVILDFKGHTITQSANSTIFNMSGLSRSTARNAKISLPAGFSRKIVDMATATGSMEDNLVENLWADCLDTSYNYTGILIAVSTTGHAFRNTFRNIRFKKCAVGIHFDIDHNDSWIHGNVFENMFIDDYIVGVHFDRAGGTSGTINRNIFTHVNLQTMAASTDGFLDILLRGNTFIACNVWDWATANVPGVRWGVAAGAEDTFILTNDDQADITDAGTDTVILGEGGDLKIDSLNRYGVTPLHIFEETVANPYMYIHGDEGVNNRTARMRMDANGHFIIQNTSGASRLDVNLDGSVYINYNCPGDVHVFNEGATGGHNKIFYIRGSNAANDSIKALTLKMGNGTHDDGEIATDVGDLRLTPTGVLRFGTKTGTGDVAVDGYVSIKDAAGNAVKLATVA